MKKTAKLFSVVLALIMAISVTASLASSAVALDLPASEQLFLIGIDRCPFCLEECKFDAEGEAAEDVVFTCEHCKNTFKYEDLINLVSGLIKESNPDLSNEDLEIATKTMIGICPDCGKETETKEYSVSEDGVTTTTEVAFCSCGFDETKHSEVMEAKSNMALSLMEQMFSYAIKYQDLILNEDPQPPVADTETTDKPDDDSNLPEQPTDESTKAPSFEIEEVSNDGKTIVVNINLVEGCFNCLDMSFRMEGVDCVKIEAGEQGKGLVPNPKAPEGFSNISMASVDGYSTPGCIAVVTLEITDEDYSFSVEATECGVTDDNCVNLDVIPVISGAIKHISTPTEPPTTDPTEQPSEQPTDEPSTSEKDDDSTTVPTTDIPLEPEEDAPSMESPRTSDSNVGVVAALVVLSLGSAAIVAFHKKKV